MTRDQLITAIDAILPQTQCRQCGFAGCLPYASAIAEEKADLNQCPPGGERVIGQLARLLGINPKPLNTAYGVTKPRAVAFIDEQACIGCTLCVAACPVDAIAGAARQMHTVIADECTGCELCVAPCPMDCITMIPLHLKVNHVTLRHNLPENDEKAAADHARARHQFRLMRLERDRKEKEAQKREKEERKGEKEGKEKERTGEDELSHSSRLQKSGNKREETFTKESIAEESIMEERPDRKKAMIQAALERAIAARELPPGKAREDRIKK